MSVAHALTYIPLKTANRAFMVARTIEPLCVQDTRSLSQGSTTPNPPTPPLKKTNKTKQKQRNNLLPPLLLQSFPCPSKESQDKNEDRDKSLVIVSFGPFYLREYQMVWRGMAVPPTTPWSVKCLVVISIPAENAMIWVGQHLQLFECLLFETGLHVHILLWGIALGGTLSRI